MTAARVTQLPIEVVVAPTPAVHLTQLAIEVVVGPHPNIQLTQLPVEIVTSRVILPPPPNQGLTLFVEGGPNAQPDTFILYQDELMDDEGTPITARDLNHIQDAIAATQTVWISRLGSTPSAGSSNNYTFAGVIETNAVEDGHLVVEGLFPYNDGTYEYLMVPVAFREAKPSPVVSAQVEVVSQNGVIMSDWVGHSLPSPDIWGATVGARRLIGSAPSLVAGGFTLKLVYLATGVYS